ncbi:MAG: Nudix family hydrolase [Rudaea sp.]|nr:Nudix family hydrolase [Rudaea sp.]
MHERVHVVAGVLTDSRGRVLLAQRPVGKHLAGLWEFPGGKCEAGEAPQDALRRELREEIGIEAGAFEALISVPWRYPEKSICLDVYRVLDYAGEPRAREAQALRWISPDELATPDMPAADRPVRAALRLPRRYVITPEPGNDSADFLRCCALTFRAGEKLVQLRSRHLGESDLRALAIRMRGLAASAHAQVLINGHVALACELDLGGVHLSAAELLRCQSRPLPADRWVGSSCHNARELAHAAAIDTDFAVLGPVLPTASHPGVEPLGWTRFAELVAAAPLPVYALGGLAPSDLPRAIAAGAQGIAGISAFWVKN